MSTGNRSSRGSSAMLLNILTGAFLVGALCIGVYALMLFNNPQSSLNPRPPVFIPTLPPTLTPTNTPRVLAPTFTPAPTGTPTSTVTPRPTSTPMPTATFFSIVPTDTPTVGPSPTQVQYPYVVQQGNPIAIQNVTHPDLGCAWMGVGGQALDSGGAPVIGVVVQLGGTLNGFTMDSLTLTGSAAQFGYGPGGYEFTLADAPTGSQDVLWVQLLNQEGRPLSEKVFFDTFADCDKNLILVNFIQDN